MVGGCSARDIWTLQDFRCLVVNLWEEMVAKTRGVHKRFCFDVVFDVNWRLVILTILAP